MSLLPLVLAGVAGGLIVFALETRTAGGTLGLVALATVVVLAALLPDSAAGATLAGEPISIGGYGRQPAREEGDCGRYCERARHDRHGAHGAAVCSSGCVGVGRMPKVLNGQ